MFRAALIASFILAGASAGVAVAEERSGQASRAAARDERAATPAQRDRFVLTSDACGASRYAHLVGRDYAQVYHAAMLPTDSAVQNRSMWRTLEYTPHQLNVVVGVEGRIVAIGCF